MDSHFEYEDELGNQNPNPISHDLRRNLLEFVGYNIFSVCSAIIFWLYKSYVDENQVEQCINIKTAVIYLAYQFLIGTILLIVFTFVYYFLNRNNPQRKVLIKGTRYLVIVMFGVYAILLNLVYFPDLFTCNWVFPILIIGIVIVDMLFCIFILPKLMKAFHIDNL